MGYSQTLCKMSSNVTNGKAFEYACLRAIYDKVNGNVKILTSMRLHNKDKIAKPTSLAWDVKLEGIPPSAYTNTHSWDE